jgi:hypothetical protein
VQNRGLPSIASEFRIALLNSFIRNHLLELDIIDFRDSGYGRSDPASRFGSLPFISRNAGHFFRATAANDNVRLTISGRDEKIIVGGDAERFKVFQALVLDEYFEGSFARGWTASILGSVHAVQSGQRMKI